MEYIESYTLMNASLGNVKGTYSIGSGRVIETRASVINHINEIREYSELWADGPVTVVWTSFKANGKMVEKCAMEWYSAGRRMCDVVWFKRGCKWA